MAINVVKIGGSLSQNPEALQALCQKLSFLSDKHCIVIIPGGGKFADSVREADKQFSLSATAAHHMAILGMDQYGLLLADLMIPNSYVVDNLEDIKKTRAGLVTIFLPAKFMTTIKDQELPKSWKVTSDSITAYIAEKLETKKVLLLKTVDGIFTDDPKKEARTKLLEHLTVKELSEKKNNTCTDTYLPNLLKTFKIDCHIVNGLYPDRVETVLNNQKTVGTIISP